MSKQLKSRNKEAALSIMKVILASIGMTPKSFAEANGLSVHDHHEPRLVDEQEAMCLLGGISKPTFYRLKFTKFRIAERTVRYSEQEIYEYIKSCEE